MCGFPVTNLRNCVVVSRNGGIRQCFEPFVTLEVEFMRNILIVASVVTALSSGFGWGGPVVAKF
jgi:hypothetical protein